VLVIKNATSDEEEEQQRQQLEADWQKVGPALLLSHRTIL
jgi:hypothetical protein